MQMPSIRNKWQVIAAALGVFILGFLAGGFSMNLYRNRHLPPKDDHSPQIKRIIDSLNLSADQKTQVEVIYNDTRSQLRDLRKESQPRVDEIRQKGRARLQTVLTPEQWKQLEDREKAEAAKQSASPK
jgi:Spy/CpxP family protein refolding chaperone